MKVSGAITLVGVLADQQALAASAGGPLRIDDPGNVATDRRGTVFKTGDELLRASGSPHSMREKRDTVPKVDGLVLRGVQADDPCAGLKAGCGDAELPLGDLLSAAFSFWHLASHPSVPAASYCSASFGTAKSRTHISVGPVELLVDEEVDEDVTATVIVVPNPS
ncbi:hypothetical protein L207DRAFT_522452 [Hyaloscypha variabilis F]|uniref:Uncharacterized protein n=1 Tax=Hyaloscypha variabilis (strain UAMH 11265 / GT02V1 / F) TaxID=1149755 RepID=A0A2J6S8B2_HYAVF|nr:hypothetical protein L207DRAFT_522452 [Hyaloscypha variabilis F]